VEKEQTRQMHRQGYHCAQIWMESQNLHWHQRERPRGESLGKRKWKQDAYPSEGDTSWGQGRSPTTCTMYIRMYHLPWPSEWPHLQTLLQMMHFYMLRYFCGLKKS